MRLKNQLIDAGILIAVFIVAVIAFSYFTNKGNNNMTADMGAATYPQVSFSYHGFNLNTLTGYAKKMDIPAMRDTATPVTDQKVDVGIQAYENKVSSVNYIVYTLDGKEELKKEKVKKPGEEFSIDLSAEGLMKEERVLEIVLHMPDEKSVYFYTRLVDAANANMLECLNYISDFHENALGKGEGAGVGAAIEPNEQGDNTTLQHVTIHSDYDHVSWGELEPSVEQGERWSVKEINSNYVSAQLEYRVRCKGEENDTDVYNVKEFFRVRHIPDVPKTYLLDYDRTMDQIFDPMQHVLNEKGVLLGIIPHDIPYMVNKDGAAVSFVVANELWNYNKGTDQISLVFSFSDAENTDVRNLTAQHEVKLLEVDDTGNTTFAVYGYMNRGEHEGEVGVAIYHYDMEKNSVEEKVFISSNQSSGNVSNELGKLAYYNVDRDMLYVMVEGTLYEYNVKKEEEGTLVKGLEDSQYVASDDGRLVAYQSDGALNEARKIIVKNLSTGKERTVECAEDECIRPLGFVKNDFAYGIAKIADTGKTVSGEMAAPMYKVEIQNSKSKVVKTYQIDGTYVLDAVFEDNMITLGRATKEGGTYTNIAPDYITNNEEKEKSNIYLETYTTELKESQVRLAYNNGVTDKEPKALKPKQVLFENPTVITFDDVDIGNKYYVYGYGKLKGIYDRAGEAIRNANGCNGVVVASDQSYVWERGNRNLQHIISDKDDILQSIRDRLGRKEAPVDIIKDINDGRSLDLTGCTTEELLYVISQDRPVIAMLDAENAVILIGYNEADVIYIDVASGERSSVPHEQMDRMTQGSGNTYVG